MTSLYRANGFLGLTSFLSNISYQESVTASEPVELSGTSKESPTSILAIKQYNFFRIVKDFDEEHYRF
tara:strand:- start:8278 stop:8481 length:204 start_codon:yes stop_codon:yes gene_type:complete